MTPIDEDDKLKKLDLQSLLTFLFENFHALNEAKIAKKASNTLLFIGVFSNAFSQAIKENKFILNGSLADNYSGYTYLTYRQ